MGTERMPQIPLFAEPEAPTDPLWSAWQATPEAGRRKFLERVRKHYLFGGKDAARQAESDGQHKRGVT